MTGIQPETATKPGTSFHAPQVRLVTEEGQPVAINGKPISPDLVSASVTLPHTGVGQTEIVLNNQRHNDANRPVTPSWRYNGLGEVSFGTRLRVDFRYGAEGWTPMILARVTDLGFTFPSAAGSMVMLKGEDLASLLKAKPTADKKYEQQHEVDMVEAVLEASESKLSLADKPAPLFSTAMPVITHEKAKSYLQFIQAFAERMDYEVFVAFDNPEPGRAAPNPTEADARSVSFHFQPARSAVLNEMVTLQWGRDIVDFKPTFTAWDILTYVTASGSVPQGRGGIMEFVTLDSGIDDLHTAPGGPAPLNVAEARKKAFADENSASENGDEVTAANIDQERAVMQATAKLRASARQFLAADITTIGFTKLKPGIHVNLTGFYAPFDGVYYITKTVHTLSAAGYVTVTSVRRPGMLDPSTYPSV